MAYTFAQGRGDWSQQAKLTAFGEAQALSADGNTALIGAPNPLYNASPGAAYVFVRRGTNWTQQAEITAPNGAADYFGNWVALSADGSTALIDSYVFTRSGMSWSQQAELTA